MAAKFVGILLYAAAVFAVPIDERATAPTATIQNGTLIGSTMNNVDSFLGVPFAQPPVGNLRLRQPMSLTKSFGTLQATTTPPACPQFLTQISQNPTVQELPSSALGLLFDTPLVQTVANFQEDCLYINVQRPAGTTANDKLPVLFWIFGGGFELGWASMYDGTSIVQRSANMGKPVIYVSVAYRVGGFGFLAGNALTAEGNTNLGLKDQRLGLQWVQENIAAFGGDPTKVTIWGESAGAISVFDHLIINGGDNTYKGKPLFRGAIMDSGSVIPADNTTSPQAQAVYDTVVRSAGCSGTSDTTACLRGKDYTTFLNAAASVPGLFSYRSLDLSYLPRPDPSSNFFPLSPEISVESGAYAKVPIIIGDQEDEGTLFALVTANITTEAQLISYLATYFPTNPDAVSDVTGLVALYPDELNQYGSPFRTGAANELYPQFKRLAAILGDVVFTLTRRVYLDKVAGTVPAWSYLSTYFYGTPFLGTFHASDLLYAFALLGGGTAIPTQTIQSYYISFVNNLDPNALGTASPLIPWPQYHASSPQLLNFEALGTSLLPDTFRLPVSNYLAQYESHFRV